jgi:hypothetical protein
MKLRNGVFCLLMILSVLLLSGMSCPQLKQIDWTDKVNEFSLAVVAETSECVDALHEFQFSDLFDCLLRSVWNVILIEVKEELRPAYNVVERYVRDFMDVMSGDSRALLASVTTSNWQEQFMLYAQRIAN